MMILILFFSIFLSCEDLFERANQAYKNGDFEKSAELYGEMIASGAGDSSVYYNMGNACWRTGKMGAARYHWEKSRLLDPSDEDVLYNLELVKKILGEKDSEAFMDVLLEKLRETASFNSFFLFVSLWVWIFFFAFLAFHILRKERFLWLGLGSLFLALFFGIFLVLRHAREIRLREGIAVAKTEIFNSPGSQQLQGSINEGRKVEILGEEGDWRLIGIREKNLRVWARKGEIREL